MTKRLGPGALALPFFLAAVCLPALAQNSGSIDLSTTFTGLPSSAGIYGPVVEQRVVLRLPPNGAVGIEVANRNTRDAFNPAHATYAGIDATQHWSKYFSTTVLASIASAAPYPSRRLAIEANILAHRTFVVTAGGELSSLFGVGLVRSARLGGTYYHGDGYAGLTYTSSWSGTLGHTQGYLGTIAFGHPGQTTETFYAGTGSETDINLQNPANPSLLGERETGASVVIKHWTAPRSGMHVGLSFGTLERADGTPIYNRREITVGLFTALGH